MVASVLEQVRAAAAKRILFLPHAVRQLSRPSRMISPAEVEAVIATGELIEDYPSSRSLVCGFQGGEVIMQCMHCKGEMQRSHAPFSVDRNGYHVHWDALPAWVCEQCGEPYFESADVARIQRVLAALDRETEAA